jgi:hypothetical protein
MSGAEQVSEKELGTSDQRPPCFAVSESHAMRCVVPSVLLRWLCMS